MAESKGLAVFMVILMIACAVMCVLSIMKINDERNDHELGKQYPITVTGKFISEKFDYVVIDQTGREWIVDCTPFEYSQLEHNKTYLATVYAQYGMIGDDWKKKFLVIDYEIPGDTAETKTVY